MALQHLAPEMLHKICEAADIADVRSLRLVSKSMSDVASHRAFRELRFYLHHEDFEMLRHFADHPILSRRVKKLVYFTQILAPERYTWNEWLFYNLPPKYRREEDNIEKLASIDEHTARKTSPKLYHSYEEYLETHRQQRDIVVDGVDFDLFREIIPKFRNLDSISIDDPARCSLRYSCGVDDSCGTHKDRRTLFENLGIQVDERHYSCGGTHPYRRTPFDDLGIQLTEQNYFWPAPVRHTRAILSALTVPGAPPLRDLRMDRERCFTMSPALNSTLGAICGNLRTFHLVLGTWAGEGLNYEENTFDVCMSAVKAGDLHRLLVSMPHLKDLSINIDRIINIDHLDATLGDVMGSSTRWTNLAKLNLEQLHTNSAELFNVLRRHLTTLRSVSLIDISIKGCLKALLPQLQTVVCSEMRLDSFTIDGLVVEEGEDGSIPYKFYELGRLGPDEDNLPGYKNTRTYAKMISKYLLSGEGPNPLENYKPVQGWYVGRLR